MNNLNWKWEIYVANGLCPSSLCTFPSLFEIIIFASILNYGNPNGKMSKFGCCSLLFNKFPLKSACCGWTGISIILLFLRISSKLVSKFKILFQREFSLSFLNVSWSLHDFHSPFVHKQSRSPFCFSSWINSRAAFHHCPINLKIYFLIIKLSFGPALYFQWYSSLSYQFQWKNWILQILYANMLFTHIFRSLHSSQFVEFIIHVSLRGKIHIKLTLKLTLSIQKMNKKSKHKNLINFK